MLGISSRTLRRLTHLTSHILTRKEAITIPSASFVQHMSSSPLGRVYNPADDTQTGLWWGSLSMYSVNDTPSTEKLTHTRPQPLPTNDEETVIFEDEEVKIVDDYAIGYMVSSPDTTSQ